MARYIAEINFPQSNPDYQFVGWDELGGETTEATHADRLGMRMEKNMRAQFENMAPGEEFLTRSGGRMMRIF